MKKPDVKESFVVQELQLRYKRVRLESPAILRSSTDVAEWLRPLIAWKAREVLVSIAVDNHNNVIGLEYVSQGTSMGAPAVPGEIFKALLLCNASAFIVAHNHPHGDPSPSDDDRATASLTAHAAALLGLKMLDFVIVSRERHHSFENSDPAWREHPFQGRPHGSAE